MTTETAPQTQPQDAASLPLLPFNDRSRRRRLLKVVGWLVGIALVLGVLNLLGVDVRGWLSDLWDQIRDVPVGYIVAALAFQTAQTVLAGVSYYGILRAAYPGQVQFWPIVTAYAVGVAMNNFLPANIGTFVTLLMFVALIPTATFAGSIAAYLVQKIFFTIAGTFVYLYLFLSVPGSFDANLGNLSAHPALSVVIAAGAVVLVVILGRIFWRQVKKLWQQAKTGGAILAHPRQYLTHAFLPSFLSWLCKLAVIAIFLAAFAIPVTFESVMWVTGSGSLANVVSFTPGAVGITQATNALALNTCCDVKEQRRSRLLDRAAADHDRLERARRRRAGHPRVRLVRREAAGRQLVHGREGEGRRAEGAAGGQAGREARRAGRVGEAPVPPERGRPGRRRLTRPVSAAVPTPVHRRRRPGRLRGRAYPAFRSGP